MDTKQTSARTPARRRRPLRIAALGLSSAAIVALAGSFGALPPAGTYAAEAAQTGQAQPVHAWPGYADLIEQVMPSVVGVTAARGSTRDLVAEPREFGGEDFDFRRFGEEEGPGAEMFRRFMERFFGEDMEPFFRGPMPPPGMPPGLPVEAMGSGFIVSKDGLIVTNNHVIDGADTVTVKFHDGDEAAAEVIGRDPDTDLALLKVETDRELQPVEFADSDQVRVGDPVIAIGSPFGLGGTVTAGIVSADNRAIGAGRYDDFLQIDAPINRGNSGGPTFNLNGEVIGVNTAIQSPTGGNVGIGFAIPANLAQRIIDDLRDDGTVERGWLGVYIQSVDADLAQALGLDEAQGALVSNVTADSPAAKAGIAQGDVILSYDGQAIEDLRDLTRAVADTDPGKAAEVVLWRDGEERTLNVDIGQMPSEETQVATAEQGLDEDAPGLGLGLAQLTPEVREQLNLEADVEGVVVTEVAPGSPAAQKGLRRGDVIVQADNQQVGNPNAVANAVRGVAERGGKSILLLVKRDDQQRFVAVPLEQS